jgi:hypothetical protein
VGIEGKKYAYRNAKSYPQEQQLPLAAAAQPVWLFVLLQLYPPTVVTVCFPFYTVFFLNYKDELGVKKVRNQTHFETRLI